MKSIKQSVIDLLKRDHESLAKKLTKSNAEKALFDVYFWQEVLERAETNCEHAWESLQGEGGLVEVDDELRLLDAGEHIVAESDHFSALIKVQTPRSRFDRELFTSAICTKYKLKREDLDKLAEQCKVDSKAPLQKRIVEVE